MLSKSQLGWVILAPIYPIEQLQKLNLQTTQEGVAFALIESIHKIHFKNAKVLVLLLMTLPVSALSIYIYTYEETMPWQPEETSQKYVTHQR